MQEGKKLRSVIMIETQNGTLKVNRRNRGEQRQRYVMRRAYRDVRTFHNTVQKIYIYRVKVNKNDFCMFTLTNLSLPVIIPWTTHLYEHHIGLGVT